MRPETPTLHHPDSNVHSSKNLPNHHLHPKDEKKGKYIGITCTYVGREHSNLHTHSVLCSQQNDQVNVQIVQVDF